MPSLGKARLRAPPRATSLRCLGDACDGAVDHGPHGSHALIEWALGVDHDFGLLWRFIGGGDAGEITNLAGPRPGVKLFGVAGFADFQRGIDEHFDEPVFIVSGSDHVSIGSIGRNQRGQDDEPGLLHQATHLAGPSNGFGSVLSAETKVAVDAGSQIVTIENGDRNTLSGEGLLNAVRNGRFA